MPASGRLRAAGNDIGVPPMRTAQHRCDTDAVRDSTGRAVSAHRAVSTETWLSREHPGIRDHGGNEPEPAIPEPCVPGEYGGDPA